MLCEDVNPRFSVTAAHYDCFVKSDSWYHSPEEIIPSIRFKGLEILYGPDNILSNVAKKSSKQVYKPSSEEVNFWKEKFLAFTHETCRAIMRDEIYYALSNLEKIRLPDRSWLVYGN